MNQEPPHDIQVEQALLGAILSNNDAFYRVSDTLEGAHFFEPVHEAIYVAAGRMILEGRQASPITLNTFLPKQQITENVSLAEYLARLTSEATTVINAPDYAELITDLWRKRELLRLSADLEVMALGTDSSRKIIEDAEEQLLALTNADSAFGGFVSFADALKQSIEITAKAYQRDGGLSGMPTGLLDLDKLMGGMQDSDLIVVAGRPGMGKSALAGTIAYNAADHGKRVGFFSLEMAAEQVSTRLLSDRVGIASSRMRRGEISPNEFTEIAAKAQEIEGLPIYVDQTGGLSISQVVSRARRLKKQRGMDLMIVDYIQLLAGRNRSGNRVQEVTEITTGLKALAKELNVPIIALSQLSRQVESRDDKRPQLSDLRESGSIEQDADVVLFLFREEYYLKNREPKSSTEEWFKWQDELKAATGKAEIIIGKQRHGPTGVVEVSFDARFTRFGNLAMQDRVPARPAAFKEREIA